MKSSARNIQMTALDDLFHVGGEQVQEIALSELYPFKNHPFRVVDDEAMQDMAESIREHGVLVPGIARKRAEGGYELIAGHRRKHASGLAGADTMPVIVRRMDDDEAVLYMVDSNLQRESLLPSEKAWAYKMKLDAIRRRAGRPPSDNSRQLGENYSVDQLSEKSGDSARNIHRYIRLTELVPPLLQMVDEGRLLFNPGVELSYLEKGEQEILLELMAALSRVPSLEQAKQMKKLSQTGKLDREGIGELMTARRQAPLQVKLGSERLKQYFPEDYTTEQMEEVIFSLLEKWKSKRK